MLVDSEKRHHRGALVGQVHNMARESSWGAKKYLLTDMGKENLPSNKISTLFFANFRFEPGSCLLVVRIHQTTLIVSHAVPIIIRLGTFVYLPKAGYLKKE